MIQKMIFYFLGIALFLAIAILPAVLYALFYSELFVHLAILISCGAILLLLKVTSIFKPKHHQPSN